MAPYYKDGYLEGVLFIFLDGDKVLVEHRPQGNGTETFIPNGKIEDTDLLSGEDYRVAAMKREVSEELNNSVYIQHFTPLGEFYAEAIKVKFYGYLITAWSGEMPAYTMEEGKKFADLEWIPLNAYGNYLTFDTSTFFMEQVIERVGSASAHE
jgi:8-oxo-dGTP pyrophosphatase MutT (NUDIX family)